MSVGTSSSSVTRGTWWRRLLAVGGATAAALAVWVVADPLGGVDLQVRMGTQVQDVGPAAVVTVSAVCGLLALGLAALLERLTRRPRAVWATTALVVLVVSLAGPLGGVTTGAKIALACMHLVVAGVLVGAVAGTVTPRERRR